MNNKRFLPLGLLIAITIQAMAEQYGGIEFPQGAVSFADEVVSYEPLFSGGPAPIPANSIPEKALGAPDYDPLDPSAVGSVSLGHGGRIILKFTNNLLVGSGTPDKDLYIFEIGPSVEAVFVDISKDGVTWHQVGKVEGATSAIDIDSFGFTPSDKFQYVRLTDDITDGGSTGNAPGADIDAVGAVTSAIVPHTPDNASIQKAVAVTWSSLFGSIYRIEESTDLVTWTTARDGIVGTGAVVKEYFDAEDPKKFYRVASDE